MSTKFSKPVIVKSIVTSIEKLVVGWWFVVAMLVTGCVPMESATKEDATESAEIPQPMAIDNTPIPQSLKPTELTQEAIMLLENGRWALARRYLERAVTLSPANGQAIDLLSQLDADPDEYLGKRFFLYKVMPTETLSRIARDQLGSKLKFPILARYNEIDNPKSIFAGQVIRVPGEAAKPTTRPMTEKTPRNIESLVKDAKRAASHGSYDSAYQLIIYAIQTDPEIITTNNDVAEVTAQIIDSFSDEAYKSEQANDVANAIVLWKKVLALDEQNIAAQINLTRLDRDASKNAD